VLLLERDARVAFPGVHAFPGGVVDSGDHAVGRARLPADQCWAASGEGDRPPAALPYWVAAVREVLEEVGILLAHGPLPSDLHGLRSRLHAGEDFASLLADASLVPATDQLYYLARWVTPRSSPRRFDTRFLVGRVPSGQEAIVDGRETVSCRWLGPRAALAAWERGEIRLIPPTVRTLDDLARFRDVGEVLADARGRAVVPRYGGAAITRRSSTS